LNLYAREFSAKSEISEVKVIITNDFINISALGFYSMKKGTDSVKVDAPIFLIERTLKRDLKHDANCIATVDSGMFSFDSRFEIFVPSGTRAVNSDGSCIDQIGIRLEDSIGTYGARDSGLTTLSYIPLPLGAQFEKPVRLKLKLTDKDVHDYQVAFLTVNQYNSEQSDIKLWFFDSSNKNYYVYPNFGELSNKLDNSKKEITAQVNQFYGGNLALNSGCSADKPSIIQSPDRRVCLNLKVEQKHLMKMVRA
jgi:hypothetical protein